MPQKTASSGGRVSGGKSGGMRVFLSSASTAYLQAIADVLLRLARYRGCG